ncbi:MAG: Fe-S cluster assembly protein SufB [Conexivisphaerales archaeon]
MSNARHDFSVRANYSYVSPPGIDEKLIEEISRLKNDPSWIEDIRKTALKKFLNFPMPKWGPELGGLNLDDLIYYIRPVSKRAGTWDELPSSIRETFERLGVPESERKFLAGVGAQFESEMVYHNIKKELESQGIIFVSMDEAVKEYPNLVKENFGKVIPIGDNKFSALTYAVWGGGSFVYVPKGVRLEKPLYAYFRMNSSSEGSFDRTLIVADEDSYIHYIENCTAPKYSQASLHSGVVEIIVKKGAHVKYTSIQNWSKNVYNLVTERARVYDGGRMEWIGGNVGSAVTMAYPASYLVGKGASTDIISLSMASGKQEIDSGGKAYHIAPETSSIIQSKGISMNGGRSTYRGQVYVSRGAVNSRAYVKCDSLIADSSSSSYTYPYEIVNENESTVVHEAIAGKISEEMLFYIQSRGLTEAEARAIIISGYLEDFEKKIPADFAVELNRLIEMELSGSVG